MPKRITPPDLPDLSSAQAGNPRLLLLCRECGGEFSAHQGDYFMAPSHKTLKHCKKPLELVTKHITYSSVE